MRPPEVSERLLHGCAIRPDRPLQRAQRGADELRQVKDPHGHLLPQGAADVVDDVRRIPGVFADEGQPTQVVTVGLEE
eukprot:13728600-Alexandrium_andersonii.AAC.1